MGLVTRCPECSVMFRLVPDQIRIAAGWVRCGQCGQVFNASAHMLPYEQTTRPAAPPSPSPAHLLTSAPLAPPAPPSPPPPGRPVIQVRRTPPAWSGAEQVVAAAAPPKAVAAVPEPPVSVAAPEDGDGDGAPAEAGPATAAAATPEPPAVTPPVTQASPLAELDTIGIGAPDSESAPASGLPQQDSASGAADEPDEPDDELPAPPTLFAQTRLAAEWPAPSFVAEARRRAFWSSRPIRGLLWLALLLLLAALALQMALSGRDWLAAREPRLAPALRALCAPLGCGIQPYRRLDAIVIDGSSFKRAEGGGFRFSVTLHNASDLPVASPALELTLTDGRDRPLVRRVLAAAELGAPPTLAAHGEFSGVSALTVSEDANPGAITGYFLTAFYP